MTPVACECPARKALESIIPCAEAYRIGPGSNEREYALVGELIAQARSVACPCDQLRTGLAEALEVLRAIQWGNDTADPDGGPLSPTIYNLCPMCDQSEVRGHAPDCQVGAILAKHPEVKSDAR